MLPDERGVIFLVNDGRVQEMRELAYEAEAVLQQLIADYPSVLAGEQIDPGNPRRWILVAKEAGLPGAVDGANRWSIDHVMLDQDAIPTIVEVKRSSDTRIRREVVGQMLDYAANATAYWPADRLRGWFGQRLGSTDAADEAISEALAIDDPDGFWAAAQHNLETGSLRLVFVADVVPAELRRIVEFLDDQMSRTQVLAIEVRRYAVPNSTTTALVPRVVAKSARQEGAKTPERQPKRHWDEASWLEALDERGDPGAAHAAHQILAWAEQRGLRRWFGSGRRYGSIFLQHDGALGELFTVSLWTDGNLVIETHHMKRVPPFDDASQRAELLQKLASISGLDVDSERVDGWQRIPLNLLTGDRVEHFLAAYDWALNQAAGTAAQRQAPGSDDSRSAG